MREDDLPFVTDAWLRSFRESNFHVPHDEYFATQRVVIKRLLARSRAAVACDSSDPDQVYGYAVWEGTASKPLLHWMFVKQVFRRMGVGTALWKALNPEGKVVSLTHKSVHFDELRKTVPLRYAGGFVLLTAVVS